MATVRPRKRNLVSEETKQFLARGSVTTSNLPRPTTPGIPSRCKGRAERLGQQQQQQLKLRVSKEVGLPPTTSSDSEGYGLKGHGVVTKGSDFVTGDDQDVYERVAARLMGEGAVASGSTYHDSRFGNQPAGDTSKLTGNGRRHQPKQRRDIYDLDEDSQDAGLRVAGLGITSASRVEPQPSIDTATINGNWRQRQPKPRRDVYDLDEEDQDAAGFDTHIPQQNAPRELNDYQQPASGRNVYDPNEEPQHAGVSDTHSSQRNVQQDRDDYERPASKCNPFEEPEGQGGETDGNHVSPSSQDSRTLETRLKQHRQATLKTYSQSRSIAASQGGRIFVGKQAVEDEGSDQNQAQADEELNQTDREILQIGERKDGRLSVGHESSSTPVPERSPKRPRADVDINSAEDHGDDWDDGWDDEDSQGPASKKRRQSSRQIPKVVARKAALQELNGRRASKSSRAPAGSQKVSAKKKPKSKSKTPKAPQKKSPRRLPVNELVTAPEIFDDSNTDEILKPVEIPEDPILVASDEEPEASASRGPKRKAKISIKFQGFNHVDLSQFRMPQSQTEPSSTKKSTYSDGFEGKEAEPIGRFMPERKTNPRRGPTQKMTVHMGQLTVVAKIYSEDEGQEEQVRQKSRRKVKKSRTSQANAQGAGGDDPMLIDNEELQSVQLDIQIEQELLHEEADQPSEDYEPSQQIHEGENPHQHDEQEILQEATEVDTHEEVANERMVLDQPERESVEIYQEEEIQSQNEHPEHEVPVQDTAEPRNERLSLQPQPNQMFSAHRQNIIFTGTTKSAAIQTSTNPKSCLKRQGSTLRHISFVELERSPKEQSPSRTQCETFGRKQSETRLPQQVKVVPAARTSSQKRREQEEIEAFQQLSMVTAPRPQTPESDSEDESEKSYSEVIEIDSEEDSSNEDEERTPESSSQDEADESEEEIVDPMVVEGGEQQDSQGDGTPEPMSIDRKGQVYHAEEDLPMDNVAREPMMESIAKPLALHEIGSIDVEQEPPQVAIIPRKSELAALVNDSRLREMQPNLHQTAKSAPNIGLQNAVQKQDEHVVQNPESSEGFWRPGQPSSPPRNPILVAVDSNTSLGVRGKVDPMREAVTKVIQQDPDTKLEEKNPDDSYRPTQPISSGKFMEVAEDIESSPTPVLSRQRALSQRRSQSQRVVQQRRYSQPLVIGPGRQSPELGNVAIESDMQGSLNPGGIRVEDSQVYQASIELGESRSLLGRHAAEHGNESQGSTILGGSQPPARRANISSGRTNIASILKRLSQGSNKNPITSIPETVFESEPGGEPESSVRESQRSYVPGGGNYFDRASQQFRKPIHSLRLSRTKSTPVRPAFFGTRNENDEMMAGGITKEEAFKYSPSQSSPLRNSQDNKTPRLPTLREEGSSQRGILSTLTKQASARLGTVSSSGRRRMKSMPLIVPMKGLDGGVKASTV